MVKTRRPVLAQVMVCVGCCCGRTDKGHPAVPEDWLKAEWKARKLLPAVHVSISRCLGPCTESNVVLVTTPEEQLWLGNLARRADYAALLAWATDCAHSAALAELPRSLRSLALDRYGGSNGQRSGGWTVVVSDARAP